MLKLLWSIPIIITSFFGFAFNVKGASSTVIIDSPDIPSLIYSAYQVANPLMSSIWQWIGTFVGIAFVIWAAVMIIGFFRNR